MAIAERRTRTPVAAHRWPAHSERTTTSFGAVNLPRRSVPPSGAPDPPAAHPTILRRASIAPEPRRYGRGVREPAPVARVRFLRLAVLRFPQGRNAVRWRAER